MKNLGRFWALAKNDSTLQASYFPIELVKMKKLRKDQKGFTMPELLMVLAISGLVVAAAGPLMEIQHT